MQLLFLDLYSSTGALKQSVRLGSQQSVTGTCTLTLPGQASFQSSNTLTGYGQLGYSDDGLFAFLAGYLSDAGAAMPASGTPTGTLLRISSSLRVSYSSTGACGSGVCPSGNTCTGGGMSFAISQYSLVPTQTVCKAASGSTGNCFVAYQTTLQSTSGLVASVGTPLSPAAAAGQKTYSPGGQSSVLGVSFCGSSSRGQYICTAREGQSSLRALPANNALTSTLVSSGITVDSSVGDDSCGHNPAYSSAVAYAPTGAPTLGTPANLIAWFLFATSPALCFRSNPAVTATSAAVSSAFPPALCGPIADLTGMTPSLSSSILYITSATRVSSASSSAACKYTFSPAAPGMGVYAALVSSPSAANMIFLSAGPLPGSSSFRRLQQGQASSGNAAAAHPSRPQASSLTASSDAAQILGFLNASPAHLLRPALLQASRQQKALQVCPPLFFFDAVPGVCTSALSPLLCVGALDYCPWTLSCIPPTPANPSALHFGLNTLLQQPQLSPLLLWAAARHKNYTILPAFATLSFSSMNISSSSSTPSPTDVAEALVAVLQLELGLASTDLTFSAVSLTYTLTPQPPPSTGYQRQLLLQLSTASTGLANAVLALLVCAQSSSTGSEYGALTDALSIPPLTQSLLAASTLAQLSARLGASVTGLGLTALPPAHLLTPLPASALSPAALAADASATSILLYILLALTLLLCLLLLVLWQWRAKQRRLQRVFPAQRFTNPAFRHSATAPAPAAPSALALPSPMAGTAREMGRAEATSASGVRASMLAASGGRRRGRPIWSQEEVHPPPPPPAPAALSRTPGGARQSLAHTLDSAPPATPMQLASARGAEAAAPSTTALAIGAAATSASTGESWGFSAPRFQWSESVVQQVMRIRELRWERPSPRS